MDSLDVKVLYYNEKFDFYNVSVKQIVFGVNDSETKGDLGKILAALNID